MKADSVKWRKQSAFGHETEAMRRDLNEYRVLREPQRKFVKLCNLVNDIER